MFAVCGLYSSLQLLHNQTEERGTMLESPIQGVRGIYHWCWPPWPDELVGGCSHRIAIMVGYVIGPLFPIELTLFNN